MKRQLITFFMATTVGSLLSQNVAITDHSTFTTPQTLLHLYKNAANGNIMQLSNNTTGTGANDGLMFNSDGTNFFLNNLETGYFGFQTQGTERFRIASTGLGLVQNNSYLNFGSTLGTTGYGFRDNGGVLEYKNNSGSWTPFNSMGGDWKLTGNAGTVAGTNFIGTTDAIDFVVKTNNTEKLRVQSGGNVGIGTSTPAYKLDVTSTIRAQDVFAAGGQNIIVGDDSYLSDVDVANTMGVYGIANTDRGGIKFGSGGATIFGYNNNIGIGTITPAYTLDLNTGTFAFGNSNSRTQTRSNAGLQGNAGAQSGFFETDNPTNYPAGASSWWHLIDVRHSNTGNNYAMQLAGSFFDQRLFFRKTNGSATQAWTEVLTGSYFTNNVQTIESTSTLSITSSTFTVIPGETITINNLAVGDRVLVWFSGNMDMDGADWNLIDVALHINGTMASVGGYVRTHIDSDNAYNDMINYSSTARYNVTTAGNYTFDVRARRNYGGNTIYIGGNSSDSREGVMTVFVVKN